MNVQNEAAQVQHDTQKLLTNLKSLQEAAQHNTDAMTLTRIELTNDEVILAKLKKDINTSITE